VVAKQKESREMYMNWGGWMADSEADKDVFVRLPGWRQKEILESRKLFTDIPDLKAYETFNPTTRLPYPGQKLARDFAKQQKAFEESLSAVPEAYKFTVPDGISLMWLRDDSRRPMATTTTQQSQAILATLEIHCSVSRLVLTCTARGEGKQIKTSKPTDGIHAYVWRIARFNGGSDMTIPTTCFWDLEDGLRTLTGIDVDTKQKNAPLKAVLDFLEKRANELVETTGGNKNQAVLRYSRATAGN
jgi:hypothetical protein